MARARFGAVDVSIWSPDDPGKRNLDAALALTPTPEPAPPPEIAPYLDVAAGPPDPDQVMRLRNRVAQGDRSAADRLRQLLRGVRRG